MCYISVRKNSVFQKYKYLLIFLTNRMSKKRNYTSISIEEKYDSLMELEDKTQKVTQQNIADKYGVAKATVSNWVSSKDKIIEDYHNEDRPASAKKIRKPKYLEVDLSQNLSLFI